MENKRFRISRKQLKKEQERKQRTEKGLATLEVLRILADVSRALSLIERVKNYIGF